MRTFPTGTALVHIELREDLLPLPATGGAGGVARLRRPGSDPGRPPTADGARRSDEHGRVVDRGGRRPGIGAEDRVDGDAGRRDEGVL
ncbi:hypothetical protein [Amycolatopsis sp. GM8]|uniref:hypothetical protein n=1 Tax=Amycolatopsis sp. GM8 TaxID=2896530 RepID=UPI001F396959|nr:hypothetical protein [Amycolatopsis sp. GM8]